MICLGVEIVLVLFLIIRSSLLGIKLVFLHPNDIFLFFLKKKKKWQHRKSLQRHVCLLPSSSENPWLPFMDKCWYQWVTERPGKPFLLLGFGFCPLFSLLLY